MPILQGFTRVRAKFEADRSAPSLPPFARSERVGAVPRRVRSVSKLALIACCVLACGAATAATEVTPESEQDPQRIARLLRSWYGALAAAHPELASEGTLAPAAPFSFSLSDESQIAPAEVSDWLLELRSPHAEVEFRMGEVRIQAVEAGVLRARFTLDRRAIDGEGIPHVARREQTWLIRDEAGTTPVVLRIDETKLLAFPGTGPQLVCY